MRAIPPFDRLRADGGQTGGRSHRPFGLSMSKPGRNRCLRPITHFGKLRANGLDVWTCTRPSKLLNRGPIATNQGFLLRPRPTLDSPLEGNRAFTRFELALPQQLDRLARRCVADQAVAVLLQARVHILGLPHVVRAIRAAQQINEERFQMAQKGKGFDKLSPNGGKGVQQSEGRQADTAARICSSTSFALAGIGVPGP